MKKYLSLILICFAQNIFSQNTDDISVKHLPPRERDIVSYEDNQIYSTTSAEKAPEFSGGMEKFHRFLKNNLRNPEDKNLKGIIFTTFIIEKDGSLTDIKVLRDIGYGTGEEAIRVLKKSPKWIPGELNHKKVRIQYTLRIPINN